MVQYSLTHFNPILVRFPCLRWSSFLRVLPDPSEIVNVFNGHSSSSSSIHHTSYIIHHTSSYIIMHHHTSSSSSASSSPNKKLRQGGEGFLFVPVMSISKIASMAAVSPCATLPRSSTRCRVAAVSLSMHSFDATDRFLGVRECLAPVGCRRLIFGVRRRCAVRRRQALRSDRRWNAMT